MDTTPDFPEPNAQDIDAAIRELLIIFEYIPPRCFVHVNVILRALLARNVTTARAAWAVHQMIKMESLRAVRSVPTHAVAFTENDPPAGLLLHPGRVRVYSVTDDEYLWPSMILITSREDLELMRFFTGFNEPQNTIPAKSIIQSDGDQQPDREKKAKKKRIRPMTIAATDCIRLYKKARRRDPSTKMQAIVDEYVETNGGSVTTILRCLSDNRQLWR